MTSPFKIMYHVSFGKHFRCVSTDVFHAFWVHFVYRWFRLFSLHFHLLWLKLISISKRSVFIKIKAKQTGHDSPCGFEVASHFKKIVFSKGWLCISLQFSINICFIIQVTAGCRYVVTKRQYPLLGSADYLEGEYMREYHFFVNHATPVWLLRTNSSKKTFQ